VAGYLKDELPVPAFIHQLVGRQLPNRQPAQHEGTRAETQLLIALLTLDPDKFDAFDLGNSLLRDNEVGLSSFEYRADRFHR
jgi:hypothetical protein